MAFPQLSFKCIEDYINFLHEVRVDRIIFGDPRHECQNQHNPIPLNWDAETIVTNYFPM